MLYEFVRHESGKVLESFEWHHTWKERVFNVFSMATSSFTRKQKQIDFFFLSPFSLLTS